MQMIQVNSTDIKALGYEEDDDILTVEFQTGSVYQYRDVPSDLYYSLLEATSKGKYLKAYIANKFPYRKLEKPNGK